LSDDSPQDTEFRFHLVGEKLKTARENMGLNLNDVALKTRVPLRHLEAIEVSNYRSLPGATYTIGFAKAYARAVGLNDGELATELRAELAQGGEDFRVSATPSYEPVDPARVPSANLAWVAAAIAALLLAAYFIWRSFALGPSASEMPKDDTGKEAVSEKVVSEAKNVAGPAIDPKGQVTLTATDTVWLRIYDADKKRLFEKEMQAGEKYDVPADANNPMINTGRPQVITVTINGNAVPALGPADRAISDIGVSAAALLAREAAAPTEEDSGTSKAKGNTKSGQ
jgi:cytoskeleton protein RodZ